MNEDQRKLIRNMGRASSIGLVLVISTIIGYAFGRWLDGKFGTEPWLMLIFTCLGIAAGFIELFRLAKTITKDE